MADEPKPEENGNRATVALVYRAVDDLGKITEANFSAVRQQLRNLEALPAQVGALHERQVLAEARLSTLEREGSPQVRQLEGKVDRLVGRVEDIEESDAMQMTEKARKAAWRVQHLPSFIIAGGSLIVAVIALLSA